MNNQKNSSQKKCEICESDSTCLCITCQNYYCDTCFKLVHDKKTKSHEKEAIDHYVPIDIKCPEHPSVPLNLFCTDEKGNFFINLFFYIIFRIMLLLLLL